MVARGVVGVHLERVGGAASEAGDGRAGLGARRPGRAVHVRPVARDADVVRRGAPRERDARPGGALESEVRRLRGRLVSPGGGSRRRGRCRAGERRDRPLGRFGDQDLLPAASTASRPSVYAVPQVRPCRRRRAERRRPGRPWRSHLPDGRARRCNGRRRRCRWRPASRARASSVSAGRAPESAWKAASCPAEAEAEAAPSRRRSPRSRPLAKSGCRRRRTRRPRRSTSSRR